MCLKASVASSMTGTGFWRHLIKVFWGNRAKVTSTCNTKGLDFTVSDHSDHPIASWIPREGVYSSLPVRVNMARKEGRENSKEI